MTKTTRERVFDAFAKEPLTIAEVATEIGLAPFDVQEVVATNLGAFTADGGRYQLIQHPTDAILHVIISDSEGNPYQIWNVSHTGDWFRTGIGSSWLRTGMETFASEIEAALTWAQEKATR